MIPSLSTLPKHSINLEKNAWADFVELSCLKNPDYEISLEDMLSITTNEGEDAPDRGSDEAGEQEDNRRQHFRDIFQYLINRAHILNEYYPFQFIDADTISIDITNLSSEQCMYLFLLYCSNLSQFGASDRTSLTKEFEALSKIVLERIYPTYHIEIFGTASSPSDMFYGGSLISRMEKLAECLHTELSSTTKNNPRYTNPSGDGGLDLVGFSQLDNEAAAAPFIPLCLAQCACSVDQWKDKQRSIKYDEWNQRLLQLPRYCEFIFVPFSLRSSDGKWSPTDEDQIVVIPIDRIRFLHLLKANGNTLDFFQTSKAKEIIDASIAQLQ